MKVPQARVASRRSAAPRWQQPQHAGTTATAGAGHPGHRPGGHHDQ